MIRKVFSILAAVGAAFAVLTAAPTVLCEGTIANVSKLPPPGETDYPDCLFTAEFILHGTLRGADFPKRAVLVLWGFRDKKIIAGNRIAVGEKVRIEAVPFDSVGPEISQRQQADDIMSFDLPYFFVESIARIGDFSPEAESAAAAPSPPTGESRFMPDVPARLKFWRVFTDRERDNFHEVLLPHAGRPQTIFKAPLPEPRPAVLRLAYSYVHNQADAEDILQETLIRVLTSDAVLKSPAHERAYLLRTAANLSKNHLKAAKLRETDELSEELREAEG